jgi:hypothetical protein
VRRGPSDHFQRDRLHFHSDLRPGFEVRSVPSQLAQELHDRTTPPQVVLRGVIIHNLNIPQAMAVGVNSITLELLY